jgi:hypothetical protein
MRMCVYVRMYVSICVYVCLCTCTSPRISPRPSRLHTHTSAHTPRELTLAVPESAPLPRRTRSRVRASTGSRAGPGPAPAFRKTLQTRVADSASDREEGGVRQADRQTDGGGRERQTDRQKERWMSFRGRRERQTDRQRMAVSERCDGGAGTSWGHFLVRPSLLSLLSLSPLPLSHFQALA